MAVNEAVGASTCFRKASCSCQLAAGTGTSACSKGGSIALFSRLVAVSVSFSTASSTLFNPRIHLSWGPCMSSRVRDLPTASKPRKKHTRNVVRYASPGSDPGYYADILSLRLGLLEQELGRNSLGISPPLWFSSKMLNYEGSDVNLFIDR